MVYQDSHTAEVVMKGYYNGFGYYIVSYGSHPCAYVEIPPRHFIYGVSNPEIDCHGDITYTSNVLPVRNEQGELINGWFIGWDYAHAGDRFGNRTGRTWTTQEIYNEVKNVIKLLNKGY